MKKGKKKEGLKISRRQFLKLSALAGAGAIIPWKIAMREAYAQYGINSPNLQKFTQPLRSVGGLAGVFPGSIQEAIPVAATDGNRMWGTTTATHYTIDIGPFTDKLHPNLPATPLWGFNPVNPGPAVTPKHLGGVIATGRDAPVQITFRNNLPATHILPVDTNIPGANQDQNRTAIHIHGGYVPWISDGGPFDWWAPNGNHGLSFLNNKVLRPAEFVAGTIPAKEAEYYYPNGQSARLVWYHDHAWGITRLNAYAGIASGYVITDAAEAGLVAQNVPGPLDPKTFYMVFQDKVFNANGSLFYASIYDTLLFGPQGIPSFTGGTPAGATPSPLYTPSCVPEFFGDTILVNGTVYPYIEVTPGTYRFRFLNACNSRFLNPRLVYAKGKVFPDNTEPSPSNLGPSFTQIGTEGGFLPTPVLADGKAFQILLAPAERADVIVDFSKVKPGQFLILYNDAPGPFPGGAAVFDYYPNNNKTPFSIPGFGPNTRTLLQIRVVSGTVQAPLAPITLPALDPIPLVTQVPGVPNAPVINRAAGTASVTGGPQNVKLRSLTLNEGFDQWGRLAQYIGTNTPTSTLVPTAVLGFFGQRYVDEPATEVPLAGDVEIWEIANLTADTHPLHFHLVNVQILARQAFNAKGYAGVPTFRGNPFAPDPNELGWKETVRMNPGEVIWVIMKFDLPVVPFTVPSSPRVAGDANNPPLLLPSGTVGTVNEYVWHCHILEHEEHDMMRPVVVIGDNPTNGLQVQPTTATVTANAASPQSVTFIIFGGKPNYTVASNALDPNLFISALDAQVGVVTLTVPAGQPAGQVLYTITDVANVQKQFTLNIV